MGIDYKEKIKKLLALAQSPNEHEAKAALLKAKKLMAEHKLSELDVQDVEKQEVRDVIVDGIQASTRFNPWIVQLSAIIGRNYCCKAYRQKNYGKQLNSIGFVGLEDDVEICVQVFRYAVDSVMSKLKEIKKENDLYSARYRKQLCDSYGYGFALGVGKAFEKQAEENAEQGWGLVMVMPQEVEEYTQHFRQEKFDKHIEERVRGDGFVEGYEDGQNFDPTKRLQEA